MTAIGCPDNNSLLKRDSHGQFQVIGVSFFFELIWFAICSLSYVLSNHKEKRLLFTKIEGLFCSTSYIILLCKKFFMRQKGSLLNF